jgi:hypothetical protein
MAEMGEGRARIIPNKNRELQYAPAAGRKLFDAERKGMFLEWFAGTANLSLSAREAGVHYRTVLRHRKDDPAFRAEFDEALAQGKVRVRAWLIEAKDDGGTDYDLAAHAPAHLSPEAAMQLLRDDAQREAAMARAAAGGSRGGRPLKAVDMDEVRRQLVTRLRALGLRIEEEEEEGHGERRGEEALGEEAPREATPPPCCAWSPSPAKAREEQEGEEL